MKLTKLLTNNNSPLQLNSDDIHLSLTNPGTATFTVVSTSPVKGIVIFSVGYHPENMQIFFTGIITNCFQVTKNQYTLFCRELTYVLQQMLPLSLRNVTLNDTLAAISQQTGLSFVTPDRHYTKSPAAAFYSVGIGYHCMDALARVYRIPRAVWQQQGDGKVFVGSWDHSYWADREIDLPMEFQASSGISNSADIPAIPPLRPGVKLNTQAIVTSVRLSGTNMHITWDSNPWGTRWINKSTV